MSYDSRTMKKDRLNLYRTLTKELSKSIKNADQETTQANSIKNIKPITNENTFTSIDPIKQTNKTLIYIKY